MCDKCNDIHTAQKEGKQDKPCSCMCHPVTNISQEPICTCDNWNLVGVCPVHGFTGMWTNVTSPTSTYGFNNGDFTSGT